MANKAKPGKQRTRKGAAKRFKVNKKGKVFMEKAAHNHRLHPKNDRQLKAASTKIEVSGKAAKNVRAMLSV